MFNKTNITTLPAPSPATDLFGGDRTYINAWEFVIQPSVQASWLEGNDGFTDPGSNATFGVNSYFNSELVPFLIDYRPLCGYSGISTKVSAPATAGQSVLQVRNSDTLVPGMRLLIGGSGTGAVQELVTVASAPTGTSITLVNPLAHDHAVGEFVAKGGRTHLSAYRADVNASGGGDHYAFTSRISLGNTPANNPDQTHYSYRATAGVFDGDATATADGVYLQCSEFNIVGYNYQGNWDIAAVGDVRSYQRNNDTRANGGVWVGNLQKSEGTKPCDAAYSVLGKWRGGVDLVNADFGDTHAAIKLAPDQRIFFNGHATGDEAGYSIWAQEAGDVFMNYSSGLGQLQFNVHGACPLALTQDKLYTGAGVHVISGGDVAVKRGQVVRLDGDGGNTYLTFNGTNVYLVTNGVVKQLN